MSLQDFDRIVSSTEVTYQLKSQTDIGQQHWKGVMAFQIGVQFEVYYFTCSLFVAMTTKFDAIEKK